jgi:hypothetical protein
MKFAGKSEQVYGKKEKTEGEGERRESHKLEAKKAGRLEGLS